MSLRHREKPRQILRTARLWPRPREILPPKGLRAHNGTHLVAINIDIANARLRHHLLHAGVNPGLHAQRQPIPRRVDGLQNLIEIFSAIRGHVQNRAKNLYLERVNTRHSDQCGRRESPTCAPFEPLEKPPLLLSLRHIGPNIPRGLGGNGRPDIRVQLPRIPAAQHIHCPFEHGEDGFGAVLLHVKHPQGRTALPV